VYVVMLGDVCVLLC